MPKPSRARRPRPSTRRPSRKRQGTSGRRPQARRPQTQKPTIPARSGAQGDPPKQKTGARARVRLRPVGSRLASVNRRFARALAEKEMRRRLGKGRRSSRQVAEEMDRVDRRLYAAQLLRSGMGYKWVHQQLRDKGFDVSLATVYTDCQQVLGELTEEMRETVGKFRDRLLLQSENIKVHMAAKMAKGSEQAAGRFLQALEFEARLRGAYAPVRIVPGEDEDERPYRQMTDAELAQAIGAEVQHLLADARTKHLDETAQRAEEGVVVVPALPPAPGDGGTDG